MIQLLLPGERSARTSSLTNWRKGCRPSASRRTATSNSQNSELTDDPEVGAAGAVEEVRRLNLNKQTFLINVFTLVN